MDFQFVPLFENILLYTTLALGRTYTNNRTYMFYTYKPHQIKLMEININYNVLIFINTNPLNKLQTFKSIEKKNNLIFITTVLILIIMDNNNNNKKKKQP